MNDLVSKYLSQIKKYGLSKTWDNILINSLYGSKEYDVENFGELYEIGLEYTNKISKKEMGKYYTPEDVASLLSNWLLPLDGINICDVGCGTGNLILNYLSKLKNDDAINLIGGGHVYLYDIDSLALKICKYSIAIKYGADLLDKINDIKCDFLNKKIKLPHNSKVISNPPYYKITEMKSTWKLTDVIKNSKELYSSFMEKIITQSVSSVIITPYSFIGCDKFYSLRRLMNDYNGFIVSFDNVPGNIFNGRKHGIFNSNSTNSVRAAITVTENKTDKKGYRISPLIRFKTDERNMLLNNELLGQLINDEYQLVNVKRKAYHKCFIELNNIYNAWMNKAENTLSEFITNKDNGNKCICVPTTCRYFTVGSSFELKRDGKRMFYLKDDKYYDYIYTLLNSSFAYWWWRLIDGGINCSMSLIGSIPSIYNLLNENDKKELSTIAKDMQKHEKEYLVYKRNAKKMQESIKFPKEYRDKINKVFLNALGVADEPQIFDIIHSSAIFKQNEEGLNE